MQTVHSFHIFQHTRKTSKASAKHDGVGAEKGEKRAKLGMRVQRSNTNTKKQEAVNSLRFTRDTYELVTCESRHFRLSLVSAEN